MWIGYPWDIREVRNPKRGAELSPIITQNEHTSLSGALRTTSRRNTPRRWRIELPWISDTDADFLRRLVRKLYGPGPFVVVDASTRNYLAPRQSLGLGKIGQWSVVSGSLAAQSDSTVLWTGGANLAELRWTHPVWARWPVTPGWVVSFRHTATSHQAAVAFYTRTGTLISTITGASGSVTGSAPLNAVWAHPHLIKAGTGTLTVPTACFRYLDTIGSTWPDGEHTAAVAIVNAPEVLEKLPSRSVSLELVEYF